MAKITLDQANASTVTAATRHYDMVADLGFVGDGSDEGAHFNTVLAAAQKGDSYVLPPILGTTVELNVNIDGIALFGAGPGVGRADDGVQGAGTRIYVLSGFAGGVSTTVGLASNTADVYGWTKGSLGTLTVADTTGFDTTGRVYVDTAAGMATLDYFGVTGTTGGTLNNVSYFNGSGPGSTLATGGAVDSTAYALNIKRSAQDRPLASVLLRDVMLDGSLGTGTFTWNGASRTGTRITRANGRPIGACRFSSYRGRVSNLYVRKFSGRGLVLKGNNVLYDSQTWNTYDTWLTGLDIGFCGEEGVTLHTGGVDVQAAGGNIYQNLINFHAAEEAACQWTNIQCYSSVWQNLLFDNGGSRSQFSSMKIEESGREAIKIDSTRRGQVNIQFDGGRIKNASMEASPRVVSDGVTATDTSLVSATAVFVSGDVGRGVVGAGIVPGCTIVSRTNATTVVLSDATTASASGVTVGIGVYDAVVITGSANTSVSHVFNGVTFPYDAGAGSTKPRAFFALGTPAQKPSINGCLFGDQLPLANTHLHASFTGAPIIEANAGANGSRTSGNKGWPDSATARLREVKASNYTTTASDNIIEASAAITVTLGNLADNFEQLIYNAAGSNTTVAVTTGKTLDGTTNGTATLATKTGKHYYCDGAGNWNTC